MNRLVKGMWPLNILLAVLATAVLATSMASSAYAQGSSGATLQADKTLDICLNNDGTWTYSGAVAVWNTGTNAATACLINDVIETKVGNQPFTTKIPVLTNVVCPDTIPGGTTQQGAFVTLYSVSGAALSGTIRNNAKVTIANHSGGRTNGPNPKATYTGSIPPPACGGDCGCALTQGYWKNHTDDPAWLTANLSVFDTNSSGSGADEALAILLTEPQFGDAWIILAHQYIAYLLNVANGACTPDGLVGLNGPVTKAGTFFSTYPDHASCLATKGGNSNPCGAPVADACVLDVYNHGEYPEGPSHCVEPDPSNKICQ